MHSRNGKLIFGGRSARLAVFVAAPVMRAAIAAASGSGEVREGEVVVLVHDLRDHPGKTWGVLLDEVRVAAVAVTAPE